MIRKHHIKQYILIFNTVCTNKILYIYTLPPAWERTLCHFKSCHCLNTYVQQIHYFINPDATENYGIVVENSCTVNTDAG